MHRNSRQSAGWAAVLMLFGLLALFGGVKWLFPLIPAALLIWYAAGPTLRSDGIDRRGENRKHAADSLRS